ncbi:hypothetical protein lpa_01359 [Legionella pneumophila 2300/99 Alcoy]|nr:hypothetical protein lpa_01359 [Legionella pneumophila 2300/99 Alcoy]
MLLIFSHTASFAAFETSWVKRSTAPLKCLDNTSILCSEFTPILPNNFCIIPVLPIRVVFASAFFFELSVGADTSSMSGLFVDKSLPLSLVVSLEEDKAFNIPCFKRLTAAFMTTSPINSSVDFFKLLPTSTTLFLISVEKLFMTRETADNIDIMFTSLVKCK